MALTPEEQETLDALNAKAQEKDDDPDDEDIEIYNADGSGVRQKRRHSKQWLIDHGFAAEEAPPSDSGDDSGDSGNPPKGKSGGTGKKAPARTGTAQRYFGKAHK